MKDWKVDKLWSDKFAAEVKSILGQHLIGEGPAEEDALRNTDFVALGLTPARVGCRIRTAGEFAKPGYRDEFTIRSERKHGRRTEIDKVVEGWGDYFFYGFANHENTGLIAWTLCDLNVFRWWLYDCLRFKHAIPGEEIPNKDGSSWLRVFRWDMLPTEFIIARHKPDEDF